jgi:hypothetical protein
METFYKRKIKQYGNDFIFQCNLSKEDINNLYPHNSFMNDVLLSWFHIQYEHNKNKDNVKDIVWNNSSIKIDNKLVYWFIINLT